MRARADMVQALHDFIMEEESEALYSKIMDTLNGMTDKEIEGDYVETFGDVDPMSVEEREEKLKDARVNCHDAFSWHDKNDLVETIMDNMTANEIFEMNNQIEENSKGQ